MTDLAREIELLRRETVALLAAKGFDVNQPRGKDGRWIEIGGLVEILAKSLQGKRGTVESWDEKGVKVKLDDGKTYRVQPNKLIQAPEKARLDAPAAPSTPAPEASEAPTSLESFEPKSLRETQDTLHAAVPKLTKKDKEYILDYTENSYGHVNTWLRGGMQSSGDPDFPYEAMAKSIDRGMRPLDIDVMVHRFADQKALHGVEPEDLIGSVIVDDAFVSTTLDKDSVGWSGNDKIAGWGGSDVLFAIKVPRGHQALYVGYDSFNTGDALSGVPEEKELILQRSTGVRVTSVKIQDGRLLIEGEAVVPSVVTPVKKKAPSRRVSKPVARTGEAYTAEQIQALPLSTIEDLIDSGTSPVEWDLRMEYVRRRDAGITAASVESHFDVNQPRGADGRWIEIGGLVKIISGLHQDKRGTVTKWDDKGVYVNTGAGTTLRVKPDHLVQAPEKARLDTPSAPSVRRPPPGSELEPEKLKTEDQAAALYESAPSKTEIPEADLREIRNYTSTGYTALNNWLRDGMPSDSPDDEHVKTAEALERTMVPLDTDVIVWRGIGEGVINDSPEDLVGSMIVDDGFLSTSLAWSTGKVFAGENVLMQIRVPAGQKGLYVGGPASGVPGLSSNPSEMELILPRGTGVKIISGTWDPRDDTIVLVGETVEPTEVAPLVSKYVKPPRPPQYSEAQLRDMSWDEILETYKNVPDDAPSGYRPLVQMIYWQKQDEMKAAMKGQSVGSQQYG